MALGGLYAWLGNRGAEEPDRTIRVSAAEIGRMEAEWRARWNRAPTPEELDGLIRARTREAALYREAVAMGLNRDDPIIRRILVQKLEGIARDLVELSLAPTDQDLATYLEENAERYQPPAVITFTHVFIDPDRREEQTLSDAAEILAELQLLGPPGDGIEELGDPLMMQRYFPEKTERGVARQFGGGFARSVFELEPERWHGPVLSGYGTHLVYVYAITEFPPPTLADVEERVQQDWVDENRTRITDEYFAGLLARFDVIVERGSSDQPPDESTDAAVARVP
jgi:hypothetical protein